ncbi:hypothetical protein BOW53_08610 [Solemya pervernicosa gill symbiont]|uniref:diguanylate cyclase n=1 Tax=Solemya pervernicosa gill symbiont TaxID=642797 RepID=A0A1T2L5A5_9GAMM|nr:GGDEF domain-containing protein [Solemya pervernicosa gill symbiont]OOZ40220.1 hypothetical protein BOW53_08610 [Solemya pervernicosa gill symbiont]
MISILVIGLVVSSAVLYSFKLGSRMSDLYAPMIDAAMEIKFEATTAHLWFEEMMSGDRSESIESVRSHLDAAEWYAQAMLSGGQNQEGDFLPLEDAVMRGHIENVLLKLTEFRSIMQLRWEAGLDMGPGSELDQRFDAVFSAFIAEADEVETYLQQMLAESRHYFFLNHALLFVTALLITFAVFIVFSRFMQQQLYNLRTLEETNRELKQEIKRRKEVEQTLQKQATTDVLTGSYNRAKMISLIDEEWLRSQRYSVTFSLVMLDIDYFKHINDEWGHDVGDRVLKEIADRISSILRDSDTLARWGGEEFMLLLTNTPIEGAVELAERARRAVARQSMQGVGSVTASFGVTEYNQSFSAINQMLKSTDVRLYMAKSQGRNRVVSEE